MGKGKVTKLKELKLMDGKTEPDFGEARTIEDIMGEKRQGPFKAKTQPEFEKQLSEMNVADMQALATRVQLIPIHDKPLLRKRLIDEFRKNLARLHGVEGLRAMSEAGMDDSLSGRAAQVLKEGR